MLCMNGHENPSGAAFCMTCGSSLGPDDVPEHASPTPVTTESLSTSQTRGDQPARRIALAVLAAVIAVVVAAGVALTGKDGKGDTTASDASDESTATQAPERPPLEVAYGECIGVNGWKTLTLGDDGRTLIIDTGSEYGPVEGLACVLGELDTSQAIVAQMESTTALMGVQESTDGSLHYQFSYHPDNGINMVITDEQAE